MSEHVDVVIAGGGPAGATVATFVAMQGHRVLLLENEQFPIHKIGESLLPSTVNGICAMLGLTEELKAANFMRKRGGTFRWGTSPEPWRSCFRCPPG
jgi:FAD-dependent halogenase